MFFIYLLACHKQMTIVEHTGQRKQVMPIETTLRHNFSLILWILPNVDVLNHSHQPFLLSQMFLNIHLWYIDSCGCFKMFHMSHLAHIRFWNIWQILPICQSVFNVQFACLIVQQITLLKSCKYEVYIWLKYPLIVR